jgi:hypothetical protein
LPQLHLLALVVLTRTPKGEEEARKEVGSGDAHPMTATDEAVALQKEEQGAKEVSASAARSARSVVLTRVPGKRAEREAKEVRGRSAVTA